MTEVRWTQQAADDLEGIRDYVHRDSPSYALVVVDRLYGATDQLQAFPDSGRMVPERQQPTLRELVRAPFRIVYRRHRNTHSVSRHPAISRVGRVTLLANEELKPTARHGSGWLAPLACRIFDAAPRLNSGRYAAPRILAAKEQL